MTRCFKVLLLPALCVSLLLPLSSCKKAEAQVTGIIEPGTLTVWLSPSMGDYVREIAQYTPFEKDIQFIEISEDKFEQRMSQDILTDKAPDLVLANSHEISFKALAAGAFADLKPYLEFEYGREGGIRREDMLTPDFDSLYYKGGLYILPISFDVIGMLAETDLDKNEGLNLSFNKMTSKEFVDKSLEWYKGKSVATALINPSYLSLDLLFSNVINYEKQTTRLGEDWAYEYYNKIKDIIDTEKNRFDSFSAKNKENVPGYSSSDYKIIYDITKFVSFVFTRQSWRYEGKKYSFLPIPTEDGESRYIAQLHNVALVPANAKHPQKAFEFIKTVYTGDFVSRESYTESGHMPFKLNIIKSYIDLCEFIAADEKQKYFNRLKNTKYYFTWQDAQVAKWLSEYTALPREKQTKAAWDDMTKRIELYLGE